MTAALFGWRKVPFPEPILTIAPCYYHNLAIGANSRQVYSWGCGTFTDGNNDGIIPALGSGADVDCGADPVQVRGIDEPAVSIAGGAYHSVVLGQSAKVYTFGAAQLGQLGRSVSGTATDGAGLPVCPTPKQVEGIPPSEKVTGIAAGFYNTLALCKSGALYCAGENQNGQCLNMGETNLRKMTAVDLRRPCDEKKPARVISASGLLS